MFCGVLSSSYCSGRYSRYTFDAKIMTDILGNSLRINRCTLWSTKRNHELFTPLIAFLTWLLYVAAAGWFMLLSAVNDCAAQNAVQTGDTGAVQWRTGAAFDEFSKSPISVSWQHAALRSHLMHFARSQQLAIVLDRRVDPNQQLNLTVKNVSIEQFLLRIAQASGTGFCRFGDCYYLGPTENAQRLLGVNAMLAGGVNKKSLFSRREQMFWPSLTTPQEVLEELATSNNFEIKDIEKIEHDLMNALNLPPMRLDMRLALLLSQFDCWFKQSKSEKAISIVAPPDNLKATLRMSGYGADKDLLQRVRETAPSCTVSTSRRAIVVTGPTQELEMARNVVIESFEPEVRSVSEKRFQLNVENKRGLILNAVAEQLAMEVLVAKDCQEILGDVVTVKVKDAPIGVLLDAILQDTNCGYSLDDQTLRIYRR